MNDTAVPETGIPDAGDAAAPRVSVIVPVYNGERYIRQALESALAQTYRDFELLVIDDGSTDASAAIAGEFAARDPRVACISQANMGIVGARNTAMRHARGCYYALLDSDDMWMPDHLQRAVAALDSDPRLALVYANVRFVDEDGNLIRSFLEEGSRDACLADPFAAILLRREHVPCTTAVFRRSMAESVGGFDERYNKLGCEDRDMWLRLARVGKVCRLAHHGADYRVHMASASHNDDRMLKARRLLVERMRDFPEGRRLYRSARAAMEVGRAEELEEKAPADMLGAFAAYARAVAWNPFDSRGWRGVARCGLSRLRG
ncbi:MAG: glycosyltransferase [Pseudoxanthomonas sp.]